MKQIIKQLKQTKKEASILIAGHKSADPDSVFSCSALYMVLTKLGFKNITLLLDADAKVLFDKATFLPQIKTSNNTNLNADLFFALDLNDFNRLGIFGDNYLNAKRKLVIDHHPYVKISADVLYSVPTSSSTCELVFELAKKFKLLDNKIATALYIGMRSDTANFRAQTTYKTLKAAGECLKYNVNDQVVYDLELRVTETQFNVYSKAYNKTKCENGLKIVVLTEDELTKNNIPIANAKSMAIEIYQVIDGVKVLAVLVKGKNKINGSFRSYSNAQLTNLAISLGGGGHQKACAFENTTLTLDQVIEQIKAYYTEQMQQ